MIKEYKSVTSGMSNASTKGYEEMNRFNQIMHEPIENLVLNMNNLAKPIMQGGRNLKKERAMTAHISKQGGYNSGGMLKIAQSAYHIGS